MLDVSSEKGRIVQAALKLAAERQWRDVSLRDIADEAGISLADMRKSFGSKTQIIAAYLRAVDDVVLRTAPKPEPGTPPRDMLFEVIMARFDAMADDKKALRSIAADTTFDTSLFGSFLNSQRWMLLAAGLDGDGPRGVARSLGLASLFASVFSIWLEDDDPGHAKTMAALDQRLRRGEAVMSGLEQTCDAFGRVFSVLSGGFRRGSRNRRDGAGAEPAGDDFGPGGGDIGPDMGGAPEPAR